MATTSPSSNSSHSAVSPVSTPPPSQPSSPPSAPPRSPPSSLPNANPPDPATSTTPSPPPLSPPTTNMTSPPPTSLSPPPLQPPVPSPPPAGGSSSPLTPTTSPPPPSVSPSPPPPANIPPPSSNSTKPPPSIPPASSTPPPLSDPPIGSPPPPSSNPPPSFPPPPSSNPPVSSPPPPSEPPKNSPPPLPSKPPVSSPPPPSSQPPENPRPPPPASSKPPQNSPPPAPMAPSTSPPPPGLTPPSGGSPPASPHSSNSTKSPPSIIHLSPPPPSDLSPPSPSPPSQVPITPSVNPTTTNSANTPENSNSTGNGGLGTGGVVAIGVVLGFILLSLIGTAVWCIRRQKKKVSGLNDSYALPSSLGTSPKSGPALLNKQASALQFESVSGSNLLYTASQSGGLGNSRSWFNYEELLEATNGFSDQNLLGEGGFGSVYKGHLVDGREVAVKQLNIGGEQGEREFKAEVEIISRIHHRHLVSLVGYCISESRRLLIYDYVPNNTLYFHLHGEGRPVMDWEIRVKIAVGAARGIAYLHEDCHPRIIHRDIKSSNILLDNNFEAQVSDFGLAKLALDANSHVTTRVMGTFGYVAPEYASSGKLTEKSDIFSFGVVLLELITGRKPVDQSQPSGEESLVEWARPLLGHALETEEFEELADPRLDGNYVYSEMFCMIEAAAACVRHSAAKRPRMGQVVRAFDSVATSDLTNGMRVGESEILNRAEQSAEIRLIRRMAFGSQNYSSDFFSQSS